MRPGAKAQAGGATQLDDAGEGAHHSWHRSVQAPLQPAPHEGAGLWLWQLRPGLGERPRQRLPHQLPLEGRAQLREGPGQRPVVALQRQRGAQACGQAHGRRRGKGMPRAGGISSPSHILVHAHLAQPRGPNIGFYIEYRAVWACGHGAHMRRTFDGPVVHEDAHDEGMNAPVGRRPVLCAAAAHQHACRQRRGAGAPAVTHSDPWVS